MPDLEPFTVYILSSKRNGTLYIGVTNDIERRVYEHKNALIKGFTSKYEIHMLVYMEHFHSIDQAIDYEKKLKNWKRSWKISLIEKSNPNWMDLLKEWYE